MCRLTAYLGPSIPLERIVVLPQHSLLEQSQHATQAKLAINGDGFGIAWYNGQTAPGLYRDVLPAWSDNNLTDICRMVSAPLFLAHVRASTVGGVSRANCHPFRYGRWSFMHNGQIGSFQRICRSMEASLPHRIYEAKRGTTDSELLFLLALANGLDESPHQAIVKTLQQINEAQKEVMQSRKCQQKSTEPNRITCAFSNGDSVYGFRYSSDNQSPTLYVGSDLDSGGCVLASEPLDGKAERWQLIEENCFIELSHNNNKIIRPLR